MVWQELGTAIGSSAATTLGLLILSKIKAIPIQFNIGAGKNGHLTKDDLKIFCSERQAKTVERLDTVIMRLDTIRDKIEDKLQDHGERIATIEGIISK